jgi:hypothetical protein
MCRALLLAGLIAAPALAADHGDAHRLPRAQLLQHPSQRAHLLVVCRQNHRLFEHVCW